MGSPLSMPDNDRVWKSQGPMDWVARRMSTSERRADDRC